MAIHPSEYNMLPDSMVGATALLGTMLSMLTPEGKKALRLELFIRAENEPIYYKALAVLDDKTGRRV